MKIRLPTGGTLVGITDPSRDVPNDCSRVFSLLPQVASYLASMQCLLKVLQLVRPLVEVVKALPPSPKLAVAVPEFLKAADSLAPCEGIASGLGATLFIKDLFCLVIVALNCLIGNLKASPASAPDLIDSIEGIRSILDLAGPLFEIAGLQPPQLPAISPQTDAQSLQATLQSAASTLRIAADALGGCGN